MLGAGWDVGVADRTGVGVSVGALDAVGVAVGVAMTTGAEVGASDSPPQAKPARARLDTNSTARPTLNFLIKTSLLDSWRHLTVGT